MLGTKSLSKLSLLLFPKPQLIKAAFVTSLPVASSARAQIEPPQSLCPPFYPQLLLPSLPLGRSTNMASALNTDLLSGNSSMLRDSRQAFVEWAKENAVPISSLSPDDENQGENGNCVFLETISQAIEKQSASVVCLSEGFHNCKEMMTLHHRIIQHLVSRSGFRLVVSESGMPESRRVADYVVSSSPNEWPSKEEEDEFWKNGLNKMYGAWVEGRELINWMKAYNQGRAAPGDFVHYCGLDIGGFYEDWGRPISQIRSYLRRLSPAFEKEWFENICPILDVMGRTQARYNYQHNLTPAQKSTLANLMDQLVAEINSHNEELNGDMEFEWARQSAISMQLAENYYRNYENMVSPTAFSKYSGLNGREIAMAHNLIWRRNLVNDKTRDQGDTAKVVVINHIIHTKTATQYQDEIWGHFVPLGQMVKQLLKSENSASNRNDESGMFNVGMVYGGGTFWNKWQKVERRYVDVIPPFKQQPSDEDGLEAVLKNISDQIGVPNFFLHWEKAPKEAWMYLNEVTTIRENDYFIKAYPLEWNGCIYLDEVSHASPA